MALRCVLQPSPPSELVSMTIAGNFNPSHQRNGMERCPKEMEKQQLSSKPLGLDPHEQVPLLLCCAVPTQISHCILCFCLKNGDSSACGNGAAGALFPSLVPTKRVSPPAKPCTVWRPAAKATPRVLWQKRGRAPGREPSCHSQDKRLSREKKI